MNPAVLLALIADLYAQLLAAKQETEALQQRLAEAQQTAV